MANPPAKKKAAPAKKSTARPRAGSAQRARRRVSLSSAHALSSRVTTTGSKRRNTNSKVLQAFQAALVAAADASLPPSNGVSSTDAQATAIGQTWHRVVYAYARSVPELSASKLYVGNCFSQMKLRVAKRNPDGSVEQGLFDPDTAEENGLDPKIVGMASEIIAQMRAPKGGQSALLRGYGEKIFLAGDLWLLPVNSPFGLALDVLSTLELKKEGTGYVRILAPGMEEPVEDGSVPLRVHRPDPEYSYLSTSSVQACIEVLEELVILTRLVRSAAINRMALSGILAIADDFDDPIDEDGEDGQTSESMNPLATDIIESGAKAIDDPSSASSWLPYILQGPLEAIEKGIRLIRFEGDDALHVVKRREALERFAQGVDLPVEAVLGHQQTTYANAAQISEDRFKIHIEPSVQMFTDTATAQILWPALAVKLGVKPETVKTSGYPPEILSVAVGYDASDLVSHPDRAKDIVDLVKADKSQTIVRIAEARDAVGLDPDEAPDDDEVERRVRFMQLANARETIQVAGEGEAQAAITNAGSEDQGGTPMPPEQLDGAGVTAAMSVAMSVAERIVGALEVTVETAARKIGMKVRERANATQKQSLNGCSNTEVARKLGPTIVTRLLKGTNPAEADVEELAREVHRWSLEIGSSEDESRQMALAVSDLAAKAITDRLYGTRMIVSGKSMLELVATHAARHDELVSTNGA